MNTALCLHAFLRECKFHVKGILFHTLESYFRKEGQLHDNCSVQLEAQTGVAAGVCSGVGGVGCRDLRCDRS